MTDNTEAKEWLSGWRKELLENPTGLSKFQIQLLKEGPKGLSQAWMLGALHQKWRDSKGIKEDHPSENKGQMQSSLKEYLQSQKDQGI